MFRPSTLLGCCLLASSLWTGVLAWEPGNTTCAGSQLDWYTNVVGETPCATYQKLRQICNSDYKLPQFRSLTPGDNCDDQLSSCCCNSIAWSLSMLCMNCQYASASGGGVGIDAGLGGYDLYTSTCGKPVNQTLPKDIQTAVCNREIKIDRNLYSLFWSDGQWFYVYTKETMTKDFAVTNNNTFTHCNSTLTSSTSVESSTPTATTPDPTASGTTGKEQSHSGAIAGGAIGGALFTLIVGGLAFWLYRRRLRNQGPKPLDLSQEYNEQNLPYADSPQMANVTPFSVTSPSTHSGSGYGGGAKPVSEEFALLPRSPQSPGKTTPGGAGGSYLDVHSLDGGERHEDAGPVPALQRSASGRLPPAYRRSWGEGDEPVPDLPDYVPPEHGGADAGAGVYEHAGSSSQGASAAETVPRVRARDVKAPLPPPSSP
ncbi:hypothetical protein BD413DRAFT_276463 [Trametes elegans]|nr:hypothetical protein BD413DRAFT_276463 [Trametes elegans]